MVVDPVYESQLVTQLVNKVLLDGKKSTAESIVYGALEGCRQKSDRDPLVTLKRAWTTSVRPSRSRAAVSVERPIRSRSRSVRAVRTPWPCAGWSHYSRARRAHHDRTPYQRTSRRQQRPGRQREEARGTPTRWPKPTKPSRTTGGRGVTTWQTSTTCAISASWPTSMPVRPPRPSASSLHRYQLQDR